MGQNLKRFVKVKYDKSNEESSLVSIFCLYQKNQSEYSPFQVWVSSDLERESLLSFFLLYHDVMMM